MYIAYFNTSGKISVGYSEKFKWDIFNSFNSICTCANIYFTIFDSYHMLAYETLAYTEYLLAFAYTKKWGPKDKINISKRVDVAYI